MRGKQKIYGVLLTLVALILGWSCAEQAPNIASELSRQSFEAWVAKYAPNAYANPYKDIYIEYIERGPADAPQPVLGYTWLTLNYTGKTLDGNIFVTRVDSISRRVGQFAYTTHYCDDFLEYTTTSTKLCEGLRQAIEQMRVGDSVRVYIPIDKGFGSAMSISSGYEGESGVEYTSLPIMFEMRLNAVTTSPFVWERDSVERYAKQHWGSGYTNDTVGMFMRIISPNPTGDTITQDSLVRVYYEEYFMDGFLSSTNIDTVAQKWHVYNSSEVTDYQSLAITPSSGANTSTHKVLYMAVTSMRKGETAEVVTVSTWAYGDSGNSSSTPEILPYQPLRYIIRVLTNDEIDDDLTIN